MVCLNAAEAVCCKDEPIMRSRLFTGEQKGDTMVLCGPEAFLEPLKQLFYELTMSISGGKAVLMIYWPCLASSIKSNKTVN